MLRIIPLVLALLTADLKITNPATIDKTEYAIPNIELGCNRTEMTSRFSLVMVRSISIPFVSGKNRAIAPRIGGNS